MTRLDPTRLYLWVAAGFRFAMGLTWTTFALHLISDVHLDPLQLVLAGTVIEATSFLAEIPTGIVADLYSRRLSVVIGYLLLGVGFILLGIAADFAGVLVGQAVLGFGWAFISGAFTAWLTDEVGEDRVGDILLHAAQISILGGLFGNVVGVALGLISLPLALILAGALLIVIAALMSLLMPEHNFKPIPREEGVGNLRVAFTTARSGLKVVRGRPLAFVVVAVGFFLGLFSEGVDRLWQKHFITNISFPIPGWNVIIWFGLIDTVTAILFYFVAGYIRKWVRTESSSHLIQALLLVSSLMTGALFGFASAGNFLFAFITIEVLTVSHNALDPLYETWINQNLDARVRATVLSFSNQLRAFGEITAGPIAGVVGNSFGLRAVMLLSTAMLLPVPLLFAYASRRAKGQVGALAAEGAELAEVEEVA